MSTLPANSSVLAIFQQLVTDSSVIKAEQQADKVLSPPITALAQGCPPPSGVPSGPKRTFLEEGVLCRMFRTSSSSPGLCIPMILTRSVLK